MTYVLGPVVTHNPANMNYGINKECDNDPVSRLFDHFINAGTFRTILSTFQQLCDAVGLKSVDHRNFYRKIRSRITCWKAQSLWAKLDKRAAHKEYRKGEACADTRVLVIGSGPCGLRAAIEVALLGAKSVVVEKRDNFSRNNVLHLWPFLITDLKNLGAKKFFGKFCAGAIDHISIRQLQCILLKVALLVGVEVHVNVSFEGLIEPTSHQGQSVTMSHGCGWKCTISPPNHSLSEYEFDVLIGADGKRNTLTGFKRKEFRGKLAIAITANFINRNTQQEARVEEISGVAFIFNQKFFKDLHETTGIDLENIVYYKDDTHYFVMTAKKQSLLEKGVLKTDQYETYKLLSRENVDQEELLSYAREAADFSTNHMLPSLDYAMNHYGQDDVAMFDFTSIFHAENASRVVERKGHKLLLCLVGDSLLEPFWPTGSGCARGFLGAFDAAFAIRSWASGKMTPLEVLAQRESVYQLLSQTKPENLQKNFNQYTINPNTRYPNLNMKFFQPEQMYHLFDSDEILFKDEVVNTAAKWTNNDYIDSYNLLRWCQRVLNTGRYNDVHITDFTTSWKSGLPLCALINAFRPNAIDFDILPIDAVENNNQLAFDVAQKELKISPIMSGKDMVTCDIPDKLAMVSYLSQFYEVFKQDTLPVDLNRGLPTEEKSRSLKSPQHRLSLLQKLRNSSRLTRTKKNGDFGINRSNKLPMDEIANKLLCNQQVGDTRILKQDPSSNVSVSAMAEILASKFRGEYQPPTEQQAKKMRPAPTLYAAQPASEFCYFCKKRVYIMERMSAEGVFFHRGCLKCDCCGINLSLNNYSCERSVVGDVRFFCYRHNKPEFRLITAKRKRTLEEEKAKENIPVSVTEWDASSFVTPPKQAKTPRRTPAPLASPLALPEELYEKAQKTPERIEFENSIEGLPEESEDEQLEHNLRASMSSDTLTSLLDEDSDSDLESSDDDAELQEVVQEACSGRKSLTWEEALKVAETLSRHHSHEDLIESEAYGYRQNRSGIKYRRLTGDEDSNTDTDTEVEADSEYESDDTEKEEEDIRYKNNSKSTSSTSKTQSILRPGNLSGTGQLPASPGSVSVARANFFTTPPEPVRLDPWKMFDMGNPKPEAKKNGPSGSESESKSFEVLEGKSRVETDEDTTTGATDKQIPTHVLDQTGEEELGHADIKSQETDEEVEDVFEVEDEECDKDAVSRAMAKILVDMDSRSSDSGLDEEQMVFEDGEVVKGTRTIDSIRTIKSKDSTSTENAMLEIVDNIENDTLKDVGFGFSNISEVEQRTVTAESKNDSNEEPNFEIDERFITHSRGSFRNRRRKAFKNKSDSDSNSSFTISTPQNSMHSSISSLSEEFENNKHLVNTSTLSGVMENNRNFMDSSVQSANLSQEFAYNRRFLDEDGEEPPDQDMLRDYQMTLTKVLEDEDSDSDRSLNESTPVQAGETTLRQNSLDCTLESEHMEEYTTLTDEGSSIYLTPNTTLEDEIDGKIRESKSEPISKLLKPISLDSTNEVKEESRKIDLKPRTKSESDSTETHYTVHSKMKPLPPPPTKFNNNDSYKPKFEPGRKLPDVSNLKSNVITREFQSEFMKKRLGTPSPHLGRQEKGEMNEKNSGEFQEGKSTSQANAQNKNRNLIGFSNRKKLNSMENAKGQKKIIAPKLGKGQHKHNGKKADVNIELQANIDDIPFADDSEDEAPPERFFTPMTSLKPKLEVKAVSKTKDTHKRILPSPPVTECKPRILSSDRIKEIKKTETEKAREKARLKSDQELTLEKACFTPPPLLRKMQSRADEENRISTHSNTTSTSDRVSDSDDNKVISHGAIGQYQTTKKDKNKKKKSKTKERSKSTEKSDGEMKSPSKKKRSLLSMLIPSKSVEKNPEQDIEAQATGDADTSGEKKKSKITAKFEKDKKKEKKSFETNDVESVLSKNLKDLKIGSIFTDDGKKKTPGSSGRRPGFAVRTFPPRAEGSEESDSGESMMSTDTTLSRRSREHIGMTEEDLNKKIARRVQQAAKKQQKQREQKRLRMAQEIQRNLEEVDVKQKELEERGVHVEMALRGEGPDARKEECELMQEWFNLVHQKNSLVRYESEVMVKARELQLEDRQGVLEQELRQKMAMQDVEKTEDEIAEEKRILRELVEVVEQRDSLVHMLEEDRLREQEEDRDLESIMQSKGFNLSPVKKPIPTPS
ncbi:hypothetical protein ScPMuIL_012781 [Solemya velum]